jgi:membrane protein DedA with SNARE-associated domain
LFQGLAAFGHLAGLDLSGLARVTSLLVLPFAHEDLAFVFGGYIIVNKLMPAGLVALSIYGGMVASDFALYGLGAAARHLPWLQRYAVDDRVRRFGDTLKRNVSGLVALCRVVPGVVFVAFVACGWTRVSLARFTAASLIVSAFYLPLMLYLVIVFGDAPTTTWVFGPGQCWSPLPPRTSRASVGSHFARRPTRTLPVRRSCRRPGPHPFAHLSLISRM